jgi:hypothetical protein
MALNHSAATSLSESSFHVGQKFNPYRQFTGILIPDALVRYAGISPSAKLAYGRLARYAGQDGRCFPAVATLAAEIGIKKRRAQACLAELEGAGFLAREFQSGRVSHYAFLWHSVFSGKSPVQDTARGGVQKTARGPMRIAAHEENHHQESQKKEIRPSTEGRSKPALPAPREKATRIQKISWADDDEKTPRRLPLRNPEMEFRARIAERHGTGVDPDELLRDLRAELDSAPMTEFLEADLKSTTALRSLRNPHGYYRAMARKIGRRKEVATLEAIPAHVLEAVHAAELRSWIHASGSVVPPRT